ncbi:MAG: glycosyltransferase family 4 protein, partial [Planctomycetes bacterium]|nr:glycosyltransferase family 4 protein [Planctomycetota bacterium]
HVLAETGYSGGEAQLKLLLEHFAKGGYENHVLLVPGAKFAAVAREMGVPVQEAPLRRWWRPDLWWETRAAYRRVQPDVVHFACGRSLLLAGLALRGTSAKKFTIRRIDYPIANGWRGGARYTKLVHHTIAICDAIRRRLLAAGVPDERITLVYDGIDPVPWTGLRAGRAGARARLGIAADAQVVSCAGILRPRKGQHVLIDAFARLANDFPRAVLFLAGGGGEQERLRAQAARLGLGARVFLPGPVKPVHDVYAASDVFTMPSFHEGLCNACLEAGFAALPQVVSDAGGNGEIVVDGTTGAVVPKGDAGALAAAIARYLRDPELGLAHGAAGRERCLAKFTVDHLGPEVEAVVQRLVAARG